MAVKQKSQKEVATHIYALDLKKIYQAYQSQKQTKAEQKRFESLKSFINLYCDNENISFENSLAIIVLPKQKLTESNEVYLKFLELYLCVIEVKIISNFLNFQLKQLVNKNGKVKFVASVNNIVLSSIDIDSTPRGLLRLNEIKKWQESSEDKHKPKLKETSTKRFITEKTNWPMIAKISKGLFERNVISNKTDFKKLINSGETIFIEQEKILLFALITKLLHVKYKILQSEGFKNGGYYILLSMILKKSNNKPFSRKYIHNLINELKNKNLQLVQNTEKEADEFILTYCPELKKILQ
jgi:hypothetical protein